MMKAATKCGCFLLISMTRRRPDFRRSRRMSKVTRASSRSGGVIARRRRRSSSALHRRDGEGGNLPLLLLRHALAQRRVDLGVLNLIRNFKEHAHVVGRHHVLLVIARVSSLVLVRASMAVIISLVPRSISADVPRSRWKGHTGIRRRHAQVPREFFVLPGLLAFLVEEFHVLDQPLAERILARLERAKL